MWVFTEVADWFDKARNDNDQWIDQNLQPWVGSTLYEDSPWYRNVGIYTAAGTLFALNKFTTTIASGFVDVLRVGDGIREGGWGWGKDALRILSIAGPFFKAVRYAGPVLRALPGVSRLTRYSLTLEPAVNIAKGEFGGRCAWVTAARLLRVTGSRPFAQVADVAAGHGIALEETGKISILKLAPALRNLGADAKVINLVEEARQVDLLGREAATAEAALQRVLSAHPNGAVMLGLNWAKAGGGTGRHAIIAVRDAFGGVSFIDRSGMAVKTFAELNGKYPGIVDAALRAEAVLVQNATWVRTLGTLPTMGEIITASTKQMTGGSDLADAPPLPAAPPLRGSGPAGANKGAPGGQKGGAVGVAQGGQGQAVQVDRLTGLVAIALDQTPQTPAELLAEIRPYDPAATLGAVVASLVQLQAKGAARQQGNGFVLVPGWKAVNMTPPKPN